MAEAPFFDNAPAFLFSCDHITQPLFISPSLLIKNELFNGMDLFIAKKILAIIYINHSTS
jgi:hypothetical protein